MMNAVRARAELYDEWASTVTETLEAKLEKKKGTEQEQIRKQVQGSVSEQGAVYGQFPCTDKWTY